MFDNTIPVLIHNLKSLDAILTKAEAHCVAKNIKPEALLEFRLYPDMFEFKRQVQLVTDFSKGCAARLSEQAVPSYPDDEKSFGDLHARIAKTAAFLETIRPEQLHGAETRTVTLRVGRDRKEITLSGRDYFNGFVLPNCYFHMTTAYNILRHNGVELGKNDFVGRSP